MMVYGSLCFDDLRETVCKGRVKVDHVVMAYGSLCGDNLRETVIKDESR